jgi:hypothetical protein
MFKAFSLLSETILVCKSVAWVFSFIKSAQTKKSFASVPLREAPDDLLKILWLRGKIIVMMMNWNGAIIDKK